MLAFILEPVPPANRTKPTSDRSVSADGKDSSPPAATDASDMEEDVALCDAKVDVAVDGRDASPPKECVNAFDDGMTARTAAAASVVVAQILILLVVLLCLSISFAIVLSCYSIVLLS